MPCATGRARVFALFLGEFLAVRRVLHNGGEFVHRQHPRYPQVVCGPVDERPVRSRTRRRRHPRRPPTRRPGGARRSGRCRSSARCTAGHPRPRAPSASSGDADVAPSSTRNRTDGVTLPDHGAVVPELHVRLGLLSAKCPGEAGDGHGVADGVVDPPLPQLRVLHRGDQVLVGTGQRRARGRSAARAAEGRPRRTRIASMPTSPSGSSNRKLATFSTAPGPAQGRLGSHSASSSSLLGDDGRVGMDDRHAPTLSGRACRGRCPPEIGEGPS